MKKMKNLWLTGTVVLVALTMTACGGGSGNSAEAEAAALPTDGILGELPKVTAEYAAKEAAASAKYEELKQSDAEKAREFWSKYLEEGNTTKFKKETLPAVEQTLEGNEIPTEVAEGLPLKLDKNLTLDGKRNATTTGTFTVDANNQTPIMRYCSVVYDSDGNPIDTGKGINFTDYPIKEGKQFRVSYFIPIVNDYNPARWVKLAKVIIMDRDSETFKQAEEQIKADKQAFKDKGKKEE